jgi:hypothetical protein
MKWKKSILKGLGDKRRLYKKLGMKQKDIDVTIKQTRRKDE